MALGKTVRLLALLSLCLSAADSFTHLSFNLCRWCEASSPICRDRVCFSNCSLSSFCSSTDEVCIAVWKKLNETMTVHTMCHDPALPLKGVDPKVLQNVSSRECHMFPQPTEEGAMMVCSCKGEHECNDRLIFDQGANGFSKLQSQELVPVVLVSLVPPVLVALLATAAFYFYRTRRFDKKPGKPCQKLYQSIDPTLQVERGENITCHLQNVESDTKIAAFADAMEWQENLTVPLPIQLETLVGKGRFAEVWKARLVQIDDNKDNSDKANDSKDNSDKDNDNNANDNKENDNKDNSDKDNGNSGNNNKDNSDKAIDNRASSDKASSHVVVAVKVFPAIEYASWRNECEIFFDPKLRHENIVLFLAAEERGGPGHGHRKYWLVLEYHGLGNLQEFLTENTLSWEELIAMANCIAKGLAHLHSDTTPKGEPKVPVAHRDLKSSNIVVKSRKDCALCDFGLALRLDISLTVDDYANSGQVGTARYMAPEVLESRVNLEDLEAFKQIDVYSMALVLWEMASRCQTIGEVKSFEPAFGSRVCDQPCVDSMRDLVLRDRGRPDIPSAWTLHQGMSVFCSTVTECWDHDPEARLTADCVVERFTDLQNEDDTNWDLNQEEVHEQVQGQVQDIQEGSGLSTDLDQHQNNSGDSDSDVQSSSISQTLHTATSSYCQESETDEQRNSVEARIVASAV